MATVIFASFLAAFAWWTKGFGIGVPAPEQVATRPSRGLLVGALLFFTIVATGEWLLQRHHPAIGEATYFLDRLQHLARGEWPYRDFEFPYGPLLLYLPLGISRFLHLSIQDGYYLSWIAQFVAGVLLLYYITLLLPASRATKNTIFLLLSASWWLGPVSFGSNYTPFRFSLALLFCLLAAPRLSSSAPARTTVPLLLAMETTLLLVSPEQGIALCGASLLFLFLTWLRSRARGTLLLLLGFGAGSLVLLLFARRVGMLLTLSMMSHGGYNFPLLPVAQHIPLLILLLTASCALVNSVRFGRSLGRIELLILLALFSLPAALGRSDAGHFMLNTMAALVAAWFVLAQYPKLFRAVSLSYIVLALLVPAPIALIRAVRDQRRNRSVVLRSSEAQNVVGAAPVQSRAAAQLRPLAPFGRPVANSGGLPSFAGDTGFYNGLELVTGPDQVRQKVDELRSFPDRKLLMPRDFACNYYLNERLLRHTLLTPYVPPARRTSEIWEPLCQYIRTNYRPSVESSELPGFRLWTPVRSAGTPEPPFRSHP